MYRPPYEGNSQECTYEPKPQPDQILREAVLQLSRLRNNDLRCLPLNDDGYKSAIVLFALETSDQDMRGSVPWLRELPEDHLAALRQAADCFEPTGRNIGKFLKFPDEEREGYRKRGFRKVLAIRPSNKAWSQVQREVTDRRNEARRRKYEDERAARTDLLAEHQDAREVIIIKAIYRLLDRPNCCPVTDAPSIIDSIKRHPAERAAFAVNDASLVRVVRRLLQRLETAGRLRKVIDAQATQQWQIVVSKPGKPALSKTARKLGQSCRTAKTTFISMP